MKFYKTITINYLWSRIGMAHSTLNCWKMAMMQERKKPTALGLIALIAAMILGTPAWSIQMIPVSATPYDSQMQPILPILESDSSGGTSPGVTIPQVNRWMRQLHDIPYHYTSSWAGCANVNACGTADCKGKALALYQRMKASGATGLYLMIGLKDSDNSQTHVWLLWKYDGSLYNLDPTFENRAFPKNDFDRSSYRPSYSYSGDSKFSVVAN
jgi:hypothetical protein